MSEPRPTGVSSGDADSPIGEGLVATLPDIGAELAVVLDHEGFTIVSTSAAFAELVGIQPEDLVGMKMPFAWLDEPGLLELQALAEAAINSRGPVRSRIRIVRPDGDPVSSTASLLRLDGASDASRNLLLVVGNVERAGPLHLDLSVSWSRTLLADERARIARDLHDDAIQRLLVVGIELSSLIGRCDEGLRTELTGAIDSLDDTISSMRHLVFDLAHRVGDDLLGELGRMIGVVSASAGASARLHVVGEVVAIPPAVAAEATMVVRDLLTNVVRHSGAKTCTVTLSVDDGRLSVVVEDDGRGIDERWSDGGGRGLANIAARAAQMGGDTAVERRNPVGTLVRWTVPLPHPS